MYHKMYTQFYTINYVLMVNNKIISIKNYLKAFWREIISDIVLKHNTQHKGAIKVQGENIRKKSSYLFTMHSSFHFVDLAWK